MTEPSSKIAVVTGASSGIGAATAKALASQGYEVVCVARRADRIERIASQIAGRAVVANISDADAVRGLAEDVGPRVDLLVNNAGGAIGLEPVEQADLAEWLAMYHSNVLGTARVTQALLPAIRAARGTIITVTSTAAESGYEGGAGYCAAKAAERAMTESLRLELNGTPIRVCEVSPGLVHTEEFSLTRFHGNQARADSVYEGVPDPLVADDIAECIRWIATLPAHVNIDRMIVRPVAQAAQHKLYRGEFRVR